MLTGVLLRLRRIKVSTGYTVKSSEMTEEIASLPPAERDRIYSVVRAMIDYEKKK